jgi:hypothetical protein
MNLDFVVARWLSEGEIFMSISFCYLLKHPALSSACSRYTLPVLDQ